MKSKDTPRGLAGNAKNQTTPMRQFASPSYDPNSGRAVSSVDAQGSREHVFANNHASGNAQIPSGFEHLDKRRSTDPRPVHTREFTKEVE
jgi:hypothetical protein